jgi:hypothetical protein
MKYSLRTQPRFVMARLVLAIHVFLATFKFVDARHFGRA